MSDVGKWQTIFFIDLTNLWLGLKGRYHFENLSRQGNLSSESYRANFSKLFDFKVFNRNGEPFRIIQVFRLRKDMGF